MNIYIAILRLKAKSTLKMKKKNPPTNKPSRTSDDI